MAELAKMYPPQANTPETSLSGALTAAGTTVNVVDGTMLPDAPNLLTIGADGSTAETVLMTAKSGNVLTVVRGGVVCGRRYRQIFHGGRSESNAGQHYSPEQRENGKGHIPDGWQPRRI